MQVGFHQQTSKVITLIHKKIFNTCWRLLEDLPLFGDMRAQNLQNLVCYFLQSHNVRINRVEYVCNCLQTDVKVCWMEIHIVSYQSQTATAPGRSFFNFISLPILPPWLVVI